MTRTLSSGNRPHSLHSSSCVLPVSPLQRSHSNVDSVNDTHTPERYVRASADSLGTDLKHTDSASLQIELIGQALRAAERARAIALLAQHIMEKRYDTWLPEVQYVFTDECYRPEGFAARLREPRNASFATHAYSALRMNPVYRMRAQSVAKAVFQPAKP